ncbi:regulator [Thiocapsa imhoffii]|uniref:Regulator n=1 Tax=Thiocapsa imhoffii TaxID=382777 RepID=A0A9X1B8I6_9GAMM|nr:zinc ribbon domain-containing protein [Thiocapsa imhoffii]MBK1644959.1 regulator [Thiocapsa imhoffii]
MPTYDYRCESNDRIVEVTHRMSENLANWGEVCERTGTPLGETPADAPVHRLATGGNLVSSRNLGSGTAPACSTGACCPGGMCGLN